MINPNDAMFPRKLTTVGIQYAAPNRAARLMLPVLAAATLAPILTAAEPAARRASASSGSAPNVLFVSIDDLNDWVGVLGVRADVKTPNIDRLAARGLLFANAHCPAPQCGPSRAAVMTGWNPATSGIYDNSQWWRPIMPDVVTLPAHFKQNGYWTEGAGKNFHHTPGFNDPAAWSNYFHWSPGAVERGWDCGYQRPPDPRPTPHPAWPAFQPSTGEFDVAPLDVPDEAMPDYMIVKHGADFLQQYSGSEPFFLGIGIFRPHQPWYVPRKYFDMYPLESIELPPFKADDRDDLPAGIKVTVHQRTSMHDRLVKAGLWKPAIQGYLASISFADAQLGLLLDALERSPHARNTIVVLWSDHGFHLGEKSHWQKWSLWQRGTHVPLIIAAPGLISPGSRSNRPVGLIDLYPTLIEMCRLPAVAKLDGRSLMPLLKDPASPWPHAAITTLERGNHSVMGERWHYIRYADGSEELYDLESDPHEWHNLAARGDLEEIKAGLKAHLPKYDAPPAPKKGAYDFDPVAYTWKLKNSR
jgi:arylsulfatase A-like enzyme